MELCSKNSSKSETQQIRYNQVGTEQKTCKIIKVTYPADVNVMSKINEKEKIYGPLIRNMQLMYKDYTFMFVPIIICALGTVPKRLESSLNELSFSKKETKNLIQYKKNCKTFLRFVVWRSRKAYSECYIRSSVSQMAVLVMFRMEKLFWW